MEPRSPAGSTSTRISHGTVGFIPAWMARLVALIAFAIAGSFASCTRMMAAETSLKRRPSPMVMKLEEAVGLEMPPSRG